MAGRCAGPLGLTCLTVPDRSRRRPGSSCATVVHVLYDDGFLYAGFQAWDPEPPLSQMIERDDPIWNDDSVQDLPGYLSRLAWTGYYFMVNGLGTSVRRPHRRGRRQQRRRPGTRRGVRRAQRTDYGWSAEIAIPLTSMSVPGGRRRDLGHQLRPQPAPVPGAHLSGPGTGRLLGAAVDGGHAWIGLDVPRQSRRHQVIPYALSRAQQRRVPARGRRDCRRALRRHAAPVLPTAPSTPTSRRSRRTRSWFDT